VPLLILFPTCDPFEMHKLQGLVCDPANAMQMNIYAECVNRRQNERSEFRLSDLGDTAGRLPPLPARPGGQPGRLPKEAYFPMQQQNQPCCLLGLPMQPVPGSAVPAVPAGCEPAS